jgi:hypothetical protein
MIGSKLSAKRVLAPWCYALPLVISFINSKTARPLYIDTAC